MLEETHKLQVEKMKNHILTAYRITYRSVYYIYSNNNIKKKTVPSAYLFNYIFIINTILVRAGFHNTEITSSHKV